MEMQQILLEWNEVPMNISYVSACLLITALVILVTISALAFGLLLADLVSKDNMPDWKLFPLVSFLFTGLFFAPYIFDSFDYDEKYSKWEKSADKYVSELPTIKSSKVPKYDLEDERIKIMLSDDGKSVYVDYEEEQREANKLKYGTARISTFENAKYIEVEGLESPYVEYKDLKVNLGDKYKKGMIDIKFFVPK